MFSRPDKQICVYAFLRKEVWTHATNRLELAIVPKNFRKKLILRAPNVLFYTLTNEISPGGIQERS